MRVVFMNWAPIWKGADQGGGVNGYLHHLAPALAARGHEVTSLFSGLLYTSAAGGPFTRRHGDFHGVRVLEIINSPVLAPSASQFREPMSEIAAPALETELARLLHLLQPDVCHWHNLEGFSARCIDVCRDAGARVVFSLHNYHTLCPQVTLSRGHRRPCHNFHSGVSCVTCIDAPDPAGERQRRVGEFHQAGHDPRSTPELQLREATSQLRRELGWPVRAARAARRALDARSKARDEAPRKATTPLPGIAIEDASALALSSTPTRPPPVFVRLTTRDIDADYARRGGPPLDNAPTADPTSGSNRNAYASRRAQMIAALNRCDRVLAVSDFVRGKYVAEGVDPSCIETMRIGTAAAEHPMPQVAPPSRGSIRMLAIGFNHFNKGIPLLLAALRGMPAESLRRIGLTLCARGIRDIGPEFRKLHPPLAELNVIDGYDPVDLPQLLRGHDLCYVGSTWWDPLPQTVLEAHALGVPVLGARAGGIAEAISDGHDGFLFEANSPPSLRHALERALHAAKGQGRWPDGVAPPKPIAEHAAELDALYARLTGPSEQTDATNDTATKHNTIVWAKDRARVPLTTDQGHF